MSDARQGQGRAKRIAYLLGGVSVNRWSVGRRNAIEQAR